MTIGAASGLIEWTPSGAAAGSHTVTVEAENAAGSDSETFTVRVVNTNEPPRNLRSDFVSDGAVDLSWEPPAHVLLLSGYEVRRSLLPGGPYAPVGEVLPGTTTFRDPTPVDGAASYYVVAALLTLGGEFSSAPSNEVSSYVLLKGEMVLSHDDGSAESALVVGGQNSEKAIELQTEPAGSFRLTKVAVFIADFDGVPLTLKVYNADNGPRPGTTREQFTYQPRDLGPGWNILDVPEILQPEYGAGQRFFVGVVEGATNNAVGLDEDSAGHSWTRVAGGEWSFLTGGELMVRAILLGAGGSVRWRRGDANADGNQELSDAVFIFNFLFVGGRPPSCESAADVNRDFRIDLSDGVSLLNFLFIGGAMPRDPFVSCGTALDPRELNCAAYDRCG
jgi:PKD repeat protein